LYRSFVSPAENGIYQLRASNASGVSTSAPVSVAAIALKIYSDLVPRTVVEGEPLGLNFSVSTLLPAIYEWEKRRLVCVRPDQLVSELSCDRGGHRELSGVARNLYGSITSSVARVTVQLAPPSIYQDVPDIVVGGGMSFILSVGATGHQPIYYQCTTMVCGDSRRDRRLLESFQRSIQ
jgi:hypothetical protein